MIDNISFNYASATSILKAINECDDSLHGLVKKLKNELENASVWWEGDSYQEYKKLFTDPGGRKTILLKAAEQASSLSSRLIKMAEKKREWEQAGARKF